LIFFYIHIPNNGNPYMFVLKFSNTTLRFFNPGNIPQCDMYKKMLSFFFCFSWSHSGVSFTLGCIFSALLLICIVVWGNVSALTSKLIYTWFYCKAHVAFFNHIIVALFSVKSYIYINFLNFLHVRKRCETRTVS
jgi:hypothetical protein